MAYDEPRGRVDYTVGVRGNCGTTEHRWAKTNPNWRLLIAGPRAMGTLRAFEFRPGHGPGDFFVSCMFVSLRLEVPFDGSFRGSWLKRLSYFGQMTQHILLFGDTIEIYQSARLRCVFVIYRNNILKGVLLRQGVAWCGLLNGI